MLGVLGLVYIAICFLVYLNQARLVYYPERELTASPAEVGLLYEDVTLITEDGLKLHAWFVPASAPRGTVLFCHGNAGNLSHRTGFVRFLHELGLSVLIFDYRGFGRSEGEPDEAGTYADALAAWRHLVVDRGIGEDRLLIFGRSMGAAVAIELATRVRPAALVIESAFTSTADMGTKVYPWLPVRWLTRIRYDSISRIARIEAPKLFVHSHEDELVPFMMGRELYGQASPPKSFLEIHGGHDDGWIVSRADYIEGWERFLSMAGF
ncbi:MAG: alpha/beta hydrolase [bacterium]|nr:alpha/beta hydrolase [bacterium]